MSCSLRLFQAQVCTSVFWMKTWVYFSERYIFSSSFFFCLTNLMCQFPTLCGSHIISSFGLFSKKKKDSPSACGLSVCFFFFYPNFLFPHGSVCNTWCSPVIDHTHSIEILPQIMTSIKSPGRTHGAISHQTPTQSRGKELEWQIT